jgi:hypothetical protein
LRFKAAGGGSAELRITNDGGFDIRSWDGALVKLTRDEVQDWCDSFQEALDEYDILAEEDD